MPAPFESFGQLAAHVGMAGADEEFAHRLTLVALAAFSAVWVTALGAAVGSFLNVVIYRLPRGMSLVRPKSHCPACGRSIRPSDNLPIIGWLRLRGRCRACGNPISSRYPLVEAATAALFLGLAHVELFTGGANLPGGPELNRGLGFVLWHMRPEIVALYLYHVTLLCLLLCLAMIAWDGFSPPRKLVVTGLVVGLVVPAFFAIAHPVPSGLPQDTLSPLTIRFGSWLVAIAPSTLLDGIVGLLVGAVVGLAASFAVFTSARAAADRSGAIAVGGLIGLFLGWQAVISCGLAAAGLAVANAIVSRAVRRSLPVTALLAAGVLIQLPCWRALGILDWWPNPSGWNVLRSVGWPEAGFAVASLAAAVAVTAGLAFLAGRLALPAVNDGPPTTSSGAPAETGSIVQPTAGRDS